MRGIGLILVDPRRSRIGVLAHVISGAQDAILTRVVGGAGQHHEIGRRAFDIQRVIGHQWYIDSAATSFADKVETVVKELTEQGHPRVVASRQTFVGRHVQDAQIVAIHFDTVAGQQGVECGLRLVSGGFCDNQGRRRRTGRVQGVKGRVCLAKRSSKGNDISLCCR